MGFLIVFLGAGIGGALRHGVNLAVMRLGWVAFPIGTLAINVLGSFLMGILAEYFALRAHLPLHWRLFLTTGVLGGFTTFSAFSLDAALLYERGKLGLSAVYILGSVLFSLGAFFLAITLVRWIVKL